MELVIFTATACLLLIVIALGIYLYRKDKTGQVKPLEEAYRNALVAGDKQKALQAGRAYYKAKRGGRLTIYDEQAITNDLAAI